MFDYISIFRHEHRYTSAPFHIFDGFNESTDKRYAHMRVPRHSKIRPRKNLGIFSYPFHSLVLFSICSFLFVPFLSEIILSLCFTLPLLSLLVSSLPYFWTLLHLPSLHLSLSFRTCTYPLLSLKDMLYPPGNSELMCHKLPTIPREIFWKFALNFVPLIILSCNRISTLKIYSIYVTRSDKTHHRTLWQKHPLHSKFW